MHMPSNSHHDDLHCSSIPPESTYPTNRMRPAVPMQGMFDWFYSYDDHIWGGSLPLLHLRSSPYDSDSDSHHNVDCDSFPNNAVPPYPTHSLHRSTSSMYATLLEWVRPVNNGVSVALGSVPLLHLRSSSYPHADPDNDVYSYQPLSPCTLHPVWFGFSSNFDVDWDRMPYLYVRSWIAERYHAAYRHPATD
ncbi:hypothetical protein MD484_g7969, partial [Candolleomyces efflorescens]